jgi:Fe-S oxidoreductase
LMNPGKIVRPSKQDDRSLFRFKPGYAAQKIDTALDWSESDAPGAASAGFAAAVEMCNNNGHCRKFDAGSMCPSYRATGNERDLTRGRANTLRLALSGQLGEDAFTSDAMYETMDLCVGCKGCKRECPTGVDMAKMKIEFLHHYHKRHGLSLKDRLIAYLPRYAPWAARRPWLANLRDTVPGLAALSESLLGLSAKRSLPKWRGDPFLSGAHAPGAGEDEEQREVVLLVDTFNNYFEPDNARAVLAVLEAAGYCVHLARAADDQNENPRPLCCGRTFLASGLVDEARVEARRTLEALSPYVERGLPVIGLEPSCLYALRDEFKSMLPGADTEALAARAVLFEEFLAAEHQAGRLTLKLNPLPQKKALLHGHCHQKAFGAMPQVAQVLGLIPELKVETVESSCCGMAGAFGYEAGHYDVSMKMAEASLLPAMRKTGADTLLVADGTSCRHQIHDGLNTREGLSPSVGQREAVHVAQVLARALSR